MIGFYVMKLAVRDRP